MIRRLTLKEIASDYFRKHRTAAERELAYFRLPRTDEEAISRAARCLLPSRKRHPHQRRIPKSVLAEAERRLIENTAALRRSSSFDELHNLIAHLVGPIPGIGELTVYDISQRIGSRFVLEPERVYLHSGTRVGARVLGFDGRRASIEVAELPEELREQLRPRELEDLLCIYKDALAKASFLPGVSEHA